MQSLAGYNLCSFVFLSCLSWLGTFDTNNRQKYLYISWHCTENSPVLSNATWLLLLSPDVAGGAVSYELEHSKTVSPLKWTVCLHKSMPSKCRLGGAHLHKHIFQAQAYSQPLLRSNEYCASLFYVVNCWVADLLRPHLATPLCLWRWNVSLSRHQEVRRSRLVHTSWGRWPAFRTMRAQRSRPLPEGAAVRADTSTARSTPGLVFVMGRLLAASAESPQRTWSAVHR